MHRQSNTEAAALGALVEVLESIEGPLVFPLHPRTESALSRRGLLERAERAALVTPPLGYLDFTALLASARVCLTDSGGVQKEAYLQSVPCLTLRDTSEWVETIEAGWNQNHNLARSDLNTTPFLTVPYNGQRPSSSTISHTGTLPSGLSGHHVIVAVWTIADTTNAFYSCSDVTF